MARLEGIIKFSGAIGDLVAYQLNGQWIIRSKSTISKKRIKNDPNYKRTRESNQEFGGASTIAKQLRQYWNALLLRDKDNTLHHRLNSVILKMIQAGDGVRGQRSFNWEDAKTDFTPVSLNNAIDPSTYLSHIPEVTFMNNTLSVDFNSLKLNAYPQGTTHFKVGVQIDVLNKYIYNGLTEKYKPETNHTEQHIFESPILESDTCISQISSITSAQSGVWSVVIYIIFYQEINGAYFPLSECPCAWQNICCE